MDKNIEINQLKAKLQDLERVYISESDDIKKTEISEKIIVVKNEIEKKTFEQSQNVSPGSENLENKKNSQSFVNKQKDRRVDGPEPLSGRTIGGGSGSAQTSGNENEKPPDEKTWVEKIENERKPESAIEQIKSDYFKDNNIFEVPANEAVVEVETSQEPAKPKV